VDNAPVEDLVSRDIIEERYPSCQFLCTCKTITSEPDDVILRGGLANDLVIGSKSTWSVHVLRTWTFIASISVQLAPLIPAGILIPRIVVSPPRADEFDGNWSEYNAQTHVEKAKNSEIQNQFLSDNANASGIASSVPSRYPKRLRLSVPETGLALGPSAAVRCQSFVRPKALGKRRREHEEDDPSNYGVCGICSSTTRRLGCPFVKQNADRYLSVYGACTAPPGFDSIKHLT
jgi:hypothetical protein